VIFSLKAFIGLTASSFCHQLVAFRPKKSTVHERGFMFQFCDLENLVNFSSKIEKLVKFTVCKQNLCNPPPVIFVEIMTKCFQRKHDCS
jgi:hypothetical protein